MADSPFDVLSPYAPSKKQREDAQAIREQKAALQNALMRAAALRGDNPVGQETPGSMIGSGPGGWAVSLGHAVAGVLQKKKQQEADQQARDSAALLAKLQGPSVNSFWDDWSKGYRLQPPGSAVTQGAPLSSPLSVGNY